MKQSALVVQFLAAAIIASVFFACSSSSEKTSRESYFEPVDKVVIRKSNPEEPPKVIVRERTASKVDENLKDAIMEMMREQNKRLDNVVMQLNTLTQKGLAAVPKENENTELLLASRDRMSNEVLLEMLRDQNQRLNDVVEQLKVLAQNQQVQRGVHSNLIARVNAAPIPKNQKIVSLATPKLDASLDYGKAVQFYQAKQYDRAIAAFHYLVKSGIDQSLQDNCYFWIGVSHFTMKRANQAIAAFHSVLSYPQSDKTEGAYFMIGQCYEQMGAKKFAKIAFERLVKEYPQGSMRQVAEKKLALLR
jgi:TolA-binding protein